ncbi:MAG: hypothetical protein ABI779_04160 [Acidobacteriota bacterium]
MKFVLLAAVAIVNPILFVTQVPVTEDFTTITSTFGNHRAAIDAVPRGGDLWIRYPDGSLKNLTRAAGYGVEGMQNAQGIAVREPAVHWSGTKALFSMVVGAPPRQYEWGEHYWQMYEITGLGKGDTPSIRKIPNQPANYNNVSPFYGTDDRILFTSDRPRGGERHLYPQLDEYEEAPTVTGIWSLDSATGDLRLLNHTPSGAFTPFVDSFGRILFTRWDHLQRDQQADTDALEGNQYGTFDYADETAGAARLDQRVEVFPEPRSSRADLLSGTNLEGLSINHFFPWEINEDGSAEETLNHIGRHELHRYFNRSLNDDASLREFSDATSGRMNRNEIQNLFQIREDPSRAGRYVGTDAPEFDTFGSGQLVSLDAEPGRPADQIQVQYVTPKSDANGFWRDPLPLANGTMLAVHTPKSAFAFRIETLSGEPLTPGMQATVTWWNPDQMQSFTGALWELHPVEVRARTRPVARTTPLEEPEARVFREEGVDPARFRADLAARNLAAIVSRDVTTRDVADKQQPYKLRVSGTAGTPPSGKVYDLSELQLFQAEQLRGTGGTQSPRPGRRVLARHSSTVKIAADGSVAALVPARRALSWQTTDPAGTPVVRERYWLTFQPGEVRVCGSCHGVNTHDQDGHAPPQNAPEALRTLLREWKASQTPATPARRRAVRP